MSRVIIIQIGDLSGDGHGQCESFYYKSNKSIKDVRRAYINAKSKYPDICPESFCNDYEDYIVPKSVVKGAGELGVDIDPKDFDCEKMAAYTAWFCMIGDSTLFLEKKESPPILCGGEIGKYEIGNIGYGLLGN
jgi:hypothetical protein